MFEVNCAEVN